jgi:hypothetical protein
MDGVDWIHQRGVEKPAVGTREHDNEYFSSLKYHKFLV